MGRLRRARAWFDAPTQISRKWTIGVNLALILLFFGGGFGFVTYVNDQRELAEQRSIDAEYATALNEFEACLRRVDSRGEIRGMFLATFDVIEESTGPSRTIEAARVRLDERYPELPATDCRPPVRED